MTSSYSLTNISIFCVIISCVIGCKHQDATYQAKDEHESLVEDSIELIEAYKLQNEIQFAVTASIETQPIAANSEEDAADDPAIWYNANNPSKSLIYGSNKKGGLAVYNLAGEEVNYYALGNINNVDVIQDFPYKGVEVALLGCSNRTSQSVNLFVIDSVGKLEQLEGTGFSMNSTEIDDIYGFCFGKNKNEGQHYVFINGINGLMQQYLIKSQEGQVSLILVREMQFESQTEGMVADEVEGKLYVGEENKGIWMLDIDPISFNKTFVEESGESNQNIKYDIEGITIFKIKDEAYLLASSQGNFSYAIFDIHKDNKYLRSFKIKESNKIDGVEETDGICIISDSLSSEFPSGILISQDGFNFRGDTIEPQNFKYIDARQIINIVK